MESAGAKIDHIERLRNWLWWFMVFGLVGTEIELILLRHYEAFSQWAPLVLIAVTLVALLWHAWRPGRASLRALRSLMIAFLLSGLIGVVLHFQGAAAFQREIDPQMPLWQLVQKALHAQAPPVLAPGAMMQLGFMGLLYAFTYRSRQGGLS